MQITALRVRNYRAFESLNLHDLPPLALFVGANGTGKSTLFDVLAFLRDALRDDIRSAIQIRGGIKEVRTRERTEPIVFEFDAEISTFTRDARQVDLTFSYHLSIEDQAGDPRISREYLRYTYIQLQKTLPEFKYAEKGFDKNAADEPKYLFDTAPQKSKEASIDSRTARLSEAMQEENARGNLILGMPYFAYTETRGHPHDRLLRQEIRLLIDLIRDLHVSDVQINLAQLTADPGRATQLTPRGENLPLVAQYLMNEHPGWFARVLKGLERSVPGMTNVTAKVTEDGRVILQFTDGSFKDPFLARSVSDGTMKMLAYLLLLNNPTRIPLLCIEEPENQLYHSLTERLVEEMRAYAYRGSGSGQVMITTHSTDLLDAAEPSEVFWLVKQNGVTTARRVSDYPQLVSEWREGNKLGWMWKSRAFDGAYPD